VLYYVIPGLLKMKRRYRILLQMDKLKKAMKDKKANHTKNVKNMMSSVCHTYLLDDSPWHMVKAYVVFDCSENWQVF